MAFEGLSTIGQIHVSVSDVDGPSSSTATSWGCRSCSASRDSRWRSSIAAACACTSASRRPRSIARAAMIYFTVDDIDEAYEAIRGRGVEFRDPPHLVRSRRRLGAPDGVLPRPGRQQPRPDVRRRVRCRACPRGDRASPRSPRIGSIARDSGMSRSGGRTSPRSSGVTASWTPSGSQWPGSTRRTHLPLRRRRREAVRVRGVVAAKRTRPNAPRWGWSRPTRRSPRRAWWRKAGSAGEDASWPYLLTRRVSGVAWEDAGLWGTQRLAVAAELGEQVRRVHALRPSGVATDRDWPVLDVPAAAGEARCRRT